MKLWTASGAIVAAIGCMSMAPYAAPAESEPAATLIFVKMGPGASGLSAFIRPDCSPDSGGQLGKPMGNRDRGQPSFRIRAGEPIYLRAQSANSTFGATAYCTNVVGFTPLPGGLYEVSHEANDDTCQIVVQDRNNKRKPPADYTPVPVVGFCR